MSWEIPEWNYECETYVSVEIPGYCRCQQHRISTEKSCGDCLYVLQMMEMEGCCYQRPLHLSQFHHKQKCQKWNLGFNVWSVLFLLSFCLTIPGFVAVLPFLALLVESVSLDFYLKGSYLRNCLESQMRWGFWTFIIHSFINLVCVHIHIHMHVVWRGYVYHNGSMHVKITKLHNLWKCFLSFIMWVPKI